MSRPSAARGLLAAALSVAAVAAVAAPRAGAPPPVEAPRSAVDVPDLGTRTSGDDWPGFLGAHGQARSEETGLDLNWPAAGPPLVWHAEVGEGYSMPSISRGRLFVFDRHGKRARLSCLHSETGRELWRSEYDTDYADTYGFSNGPRSSPVVDGSRVYTFGVEGRLRCHDVRDGTLLWDVDTQERFGVVQNFFGVGATPAVEGDLLIVPVGGSPAGSPDIHTGEVRGNGSGIVALDKRTGEVRWRATDELAAYASPVLATIGERRWGFVLARGGLVGFEPASGKVDFRFAWRSKKLQSVNAANPVVVGDTVLISEGYGPGSALLRVRPGGYEVVWQDGPGRDRLLLAHWSTPVHHDGWLYGCSGAGSGEAELRALRVATGEVAWRRPGLGRTTLLYVDGHLIVLAERGTLRLVRATPEGYREVAAVDPEVPGRPGVALLEYPAWNPPVLSHGLLYVRGKNRLACFDLAPRRPAPAAAPVSEREGQR